MTGYLGGFCLQDPQRCSRAGQYRSGGHQHYCDRVQSPITHTDSLSGAFANEKPTRRCCIWLRSWTESGASDRVGDFFSTTTALHPSAVTGVKNDRTTSTPRVFVAPGLPQMTRIAITK